jgi:uncharacterized protein (TIGR02646 family)
VIRADRSAVVTPESLTREAKTGENKGKTEEQVIIEKYAAYLLDNTPDKKFVFDFKAYKADDVKLALAQLFRGKCAYCESRYAGTQPMDVEHFRPKGGVEEIGPDGKAHLAEGYPWLAAHWTNLLPSCIDCNRPRIQHDALTGVDEKLGKANQFPVTGPRMVPPTPGSPTLPAEDAALIIDPTVDDPPSHLDFRDDGIVTSTTDKGRQSIRVYALNRAELVFERLGLSRLIEQRLTIIEALAGIVAGPGISDAVRLDLQDLVSHEIDALMELAEPGRPFSAMARQLIDENSPLQLAPTPALPAPVAAMLQRFADADPGTHHATLATRLAALGFVPNLPPVSPFVRWTVTGTVRTASLFQEKLGLVSDRVGQLAFASGLPGADIRVNDPPKVRYTYQQAQLDAVLDAATRFRAWADGTA